MKMLWKRTTVRAAFPENVPERYMFEKSHRYLCEAGSYVSSMHNAECDRSVQSGQVVGDILQRVGDRPVISI